MRAALVRDRARSARIERVNLSGFCFALPLEALLRRPLETRTIKTRKFANANAKQSTRQSRDRGAVTLPLSDQSARRWPFEHDLELPTTKTTTTSERSSRADRFSIEFQSAAT